MHPVHMKQKRISSQHIVMHCDKVFVFDVHRIENFSLSPSTFTFICTLVHDARTDKKFYICYFTLLHYLERGGQWTDMSFDLKGILWFVRWSLGMAWWYFGRWLFGSGPPQGIMWHSLWAEWEWAYGGMCAGTGNIAGRNLCFHSGPVVSLL